MAFGDRLKGFKEKIGKGLGKIDPFAGRLLGGGEDDRKKAAPKPQYYGGSEEKYEKYQKQYDDGVVRANQRVTGGLQGADRSVADAQGYTNAEMLRSDNLTNKQAQLEFDARNGFDRSVGDYGQVRGQTIRDADAIRQQSMGLEDTYRRTADRQFAINQDRNVRALQSAAASGGSAGSLREAMATAGEANANAAAQAEITRANEFNALQGMKMQGLASSAGIRQGVGAQDQSLAGLQSGRQVGALGAQESLINQRANLFGAQADRGLSAAGMRTQSGLTQQGNYLGARAAVEGQQLGANRDSENQRQAWARDQYNAKWFPLARDFNQM